MVRDALISASPLPSLAIPSLECRSVSGTGKQYLSAAGVVTRDLASVGRAGGDGQEGRVRARPRHAQAVQQPLERGLVRHEQPLVGDRERGVEAAHLERDAEPSRSLRGLTTRSASGAASTVTYQPGPT